MLRWGSCLVVLWGLQVSAAEAVEPRGTCWVAAVSMNQDAKFSEDWNQFAEETALVFARQQGVIFSKVQARTVVGRNATRPAIGALIRWAFLNAKRDDLVVVHIGCHGGTEPKDGWSIDTMDHQLIYGRELKAAAANVDCPVLFVIDTCGSGGFARPHQRDVPLPENCAAICSSRAKQSTTNVLNMAFNEALWGAGDLNNDDVVDLGELKTYIENRFRRISPKAESRQDSETPVFVIGSRCDLSVKLTTDSDDLVAVVHGRQWHLARVLSRDGETVKLHPLGYQDDPNKGFYLFGEAPAKRVFNMDDGFLPATLIDGDQQTPVIVTERGGGTVKVRRPTQRRQREEEDVDRQSIRFPFPIDQ
jgi:hypothetical protein